MIMIIEIVLRTLSLTGIILEHGPQSFSIVEIKSATVKRMEINGHGDLTVFI